MAAITDFKAILLPIAGLIAAEPRQDISRIESWVAQNLTAEDARASGMRDLYNAEVVTAMGTVYNNSQANANAWIDTAIQSLQAQLPVAVVPTTLYIVMTPEFTLNYGRTYAPNGDVMTRGNNGRYPLPEDLDTYIRTRLHARIRALLPHKILFTYSSAYYPKAAPALRGKWPILNRITILTSDLVFPENFAVKTGVNGEVDNVNTVAFVATVGALPGTRIEFPHWTKTDPTIGPPPGNVTYPLALGFATCDDLIRVNVPNIHILIISGSGSPFAYVGRLDLRHSFLMNDLLSWNNDPLIGTNTKFKYQLWAAGYYRFIDQDPQLAPLPESVADTFRGQREGRLAPGFGAGDHIKKMDDSMSRCYHWSNPEAGTPPASNPGYTEVIPIPPRKL